MKLQLPQGFATFLILAALTALAGLCALGGATVLERAGGWRTRLAGEMTVAIRPAPAGTSDAEVTRAAEILAGTRGVAEVQVLDRSRVAGLLAPWTAGARGPDLAILPRLIAVESEGCPTLNAALAAGRIVEIQPSGLAADSLGARRVGELMFPFAQRQVSQSVLVSDAAISAAQALLWRQMRIAAEPGGAAALAALAGGAFTPAENERIGVLVCGANVDLRMLADTLERPAAPHLAG
jgi:hypothetical protein